MIWNKVDDSHCSNDIQSNPKDFVEYKFFGSNYLSKSQIISRAGKASGK